MSPAYVEPLSGARYPLNVPRWRSDDGRPLMITDLPGIGRADVDAARRSDARALAVAVPCSTPEPRSINGDGAGDPSTVLPDGRRPPNVADP